MTTTLLIGRSDVALSLANGANYVVMTKFQAAYTGRVEEIHLRVKASTTGYVTLGVYADSSGSPGALLATTASTLVSSDSERYLTIALTSSLAVTYGTYYWIAFNSDVSIVGARVETSTRRYKAYAYASLPDPAGSGYSSDTTYGDITAGWGNVLQSVTPSGIASTLAFGSPVLTSVARIYPSGIASTLAFGLPIVGHGVTGITVTAIASTLAIGRPFIRAAGHYIIAASYAEDTPLSNYFYVIGRDITGAQVSGSSEDTAETALIGSRLDVIHDGAVPSSTVAASVAAARVARARLEKRRAGITIPPHCGLELWDVVSITDSQGNQSARSYRVVSYRLDYDIGKSLYRHTIELSEV